MLGRAVSDVRQRSVTNNYGCGYGDFSTGPFSATMTAICVAASLTSLFVPLFPIFFPSFRVLDCLP